MLLGSGLGWIDFHRNESTQGLEFMLPQHYKRVRFGSRDTSAHCEHRLCWFGRVTAHLGETTAHTLDW